MQVTPSEVSEIAAILHAEVARRNEWYGLDNWDFHEVVEFVLRNAGVRLA